MFQKNYQKFKRHVRKAIRREKQTVLPHFLPSPVASCRLSVLSHLALQQAGRNPSQATLSKYWTSTTSKLNFDDFCEILKCEKKTEETELLRAFKKMDVNGDGYISHSELEKALTNVSCLQDCILTNQVSMYCFRFMLRYTTVYNCTTVTPQPLYFRCRVPKCKMTKNHWLAVASNFSELKNMLHLPEWRENDHRRGECYFVITGRQQRWETGLCRSKLRQVWSDCFHLS